MKQQFTFIAALHAPDNLEVWHGEVANTWDDAERLMIWDVDAETLPWREEGDISVEEFINERCEARTSEAHHYTEIRFDDDDGVVFVWKLTELREAV